MANVVSPDEKDGSVWINQDAVFSLAHAEKDLYLLIKINSTAMVYIFL